MSEIDSAISRLADSCKSANVENPFNRPSMDAELLALKSVLEALGQIRDADAQRRVLIHAERYFNLFPQGRYY